jgi:hypothetical protein
MAKTTPTSRDSIRNSTDPSMRVVVSNRSTACYHATHRGDPACGIDSPKNEFVEWPVARARAWRDPCSYCFPDGDFV